MAREYERQRLVLKRVEENDPTLTSVTLRLKNNADDLAKLQQLAKSSYIEELALTVPLSDDQVDLISNSLVGISSLQTLRLDLPEVSDSGFSRLIDFLRHQPSPVRRFELRTNRLSSSGAAQIIEPLLCQMSVTELDLYATQCDLHDLSIGDSGIEYIKSALKKRDKPMEYLGIRQHGITDAGVTVLVQGIRDSPGVRTLSLHGNQITKSGASILARLVKELKCFRAIILEGNGGLGDDGAIVLAQALCSNPSVYHVNLKACGVGDGGAMRFAETLYNVGQTGGLEELILDANSELGDAAVEVIAEALSENRTLRLLSLKSCRIGDEGGVQLARALKRNDRLEELYLDGNEIGDATALELAEAIKVNRSLRHLHLSKTHIRSQGQNKLTDALKVNNVLLSVGLSETTGSGVVDILAVEGLLMKNRELKEIKEELERVKRERDQALDKLRKIDTTLRQT